MLCGSYTQTGRSGHFGITSAIGGRLTEACDSTVSCFPKNVGATCRQRCKPMGAWRGNRLRSGSSVDDSRSLTCTYVLIAFRQSAGLTAPVFAVAHERASDLERG